jgi:hypothetical protein
MPNKGWRKTDPPSMAVCHPTRKLHCRGMCKDCYGRWYRKQNLKKRFLTRAAVVPALCHPNRRALVKGKFKGRCEPCAIKSYRDKRKAEGRPYARRVVGACACGKPATCSIKTKPQCRSCWDKLRWKQGGKLRRQLARDRRLKNAS